MDEAYHHLKETRFNDVTRFDGVTIATCNGKERYMPNLRPTERRPIAKEAAALASVSTFHATCCRLLMATVIITVSLLD